MRSGSRSSKGPTNIGYVGTHTQDLLFFTLLVEEFKSTKHTDLSFGSYPQPLPECEVSCDVRILLVAALVRRRVPFYSVKVFPISKSWLY